MGKFGITVTVKIDGLRETLAKFRELPKEANDQLRTESQKLSGDLADVIKANAGSEGRQWGILARTVKARKDRVPVVTAGGAVKLGRNREPAYKLLFGAEFGATYLHQFKPRTPGNEGYVFFKSAKRMQPTIGEAWNRAADDIVTRFGE
jgi:hypothetical protein